MDPLRMAGSSGRATQQPKTRSLFEPPGGVLMWIVVALELITFSIIFVMLAAFRAGNPTVFAEGQRLLDPGLGLAQTITLLTSGWLIAEAVHSYRAGHIPKTRRFYTGGIAVGLAFVVLKVVAYESKIQAGLGLGSDFGTAYFLATGFHFIHVVVGLVMLLSVAVRVGRKTFEDDEISIAGTALFWHMCDIAWFFLFPLFYVM